MLTRNMNAYLDQDRGNETKRAIEKLREMGCGLVDDFLVADDEDAESVRPPSLTTRAKHRTDGIIDLRSERRKNSLLVSSRLDMALQVHYGSSTCHFTGWRRQG